MTELQIHWCRSGEHSINFRDDFCCKRAEEAYKTKGLINIPHYAIGLPNGMVIPYCPFCGAKVVSINDETGERLEWAKKI